MNTPQPSTCPRCHNPLLPPSGGLVPICRACLLDTVFDTDNPADTASPFSPPGQADSEGSFGHFLLESEIGHGGMGVVYRANEYASGRIVALKMMHMMHLKTPDMLRRFEAEVRAVAALDHPNIMPVYEVGQYDGIPFFSMKFAEHGSLAGKAPEYKNRPRDTAALAAKIARAVSHAHKRGVIHRDLKPGNVLLDADDEPYVADFGIAKIADSQTTSTASTLTLGTPAYMAPELINGALGEITTAVDIYGLGAILYELLAGTPPIVGRSSAAVMRQLAKGPPPPPHTLNPDVGPEFSAVCMKCLAHQPDDRYANAGDVAADLENWLAGRPVNARPPGRLGTLVRWCRREPIVAGLTAGIAILLLGIGIGSTAVAINIARQRDRARIAERNAQDELYHSLLIRSQLGRQTGMAGHRYQGLDSLQQAARINITNDLRNEAAALLALTDIRVDRTIKARPSQAGAITFAPDFTHYAVCTETREISLRDLSGNTELARLPGTGQSILSLSEFSCDSRYFASRHFNGSIRIWDARERRLAFELSDRTPRDRPYLSSRFWFGCAFSPDSKTAAVELETGGYTLHDIDDGGRETARIPLPRGPLALAFHPDAVRIAVGNRSGSTAEIRDARTGALMHTLAHPARVIHLAWSPDGRQLAIACLDTNIYIWKSESGALERTLQGHRDRVHQVAYSPNGRLLASTSVDKTIVLWESASGSRLVTLPGHGDEPVMRFSAAGDRLVTGDFSPDPAILEIATGDDICRTFTPAGIANMSVITGGVDFSPDSRWLATTTRTTVNLWNLVTNELALELHPGPETEVSALFTPDGSSLLVASRNTGIASYPFDTRATATPLGEPERLTIMKGYTMSDFGRNARHALLTERRSGSALLWPLGSIGAADVRKFAVQSEAWDIALSPDGKILATTCAAQGDRPGSKHLQLWDAQTGAKLHDLEGGDGGLVRFTPDGGHILASSPGNFGLRIWDAGTLELKSNDPDLNKVFTYSLSQDGRYLCVSMQRDVWLYQGDHYNEPVIKLTPPGGSSQIPKMAFSRDGRLLAIHESDGTVHLWNLQTLRAALSGYQLDWKNP